MIIIVVVGGTLVFVFTQGFFSESEADNHEILADVNPDQASKYFQEPEDLSKYRKFNSTDTQTEIGYALDVCENHYITATSLFCLEKELTDYEKWLFKIKADCWNYKECINDKKLDRILELLEAQRLQIKVIDN